MVAPEAVASEAVAASSSSTGLYDFFPTAKTFFTGKKMEESKVKELVAEERVVHSEEKKVTEERVVNVGSKKMESKVKEAVAKLRVGKGADQGETELPKEVAACDLWGKEAVRLVER